jgi:hypothetical protein
MIRRFLVRVGIDQVVLGVLTHRISLVERCTAVQTIALVSRGPTRSSLVNGKSKGDLLPKTQRSVFFSFVIRDQRIIIGTMMYE